VRRAASASADADADADAGAGAAINPPDMPDGGIAGAVP